MHSLLLDEFWISWDVTAEHLDEAESLLDTREAWLDAPHHDLAMLEGGPEQRLLAHLDALALGGPLVAERVLLATLEDPEQDMMKIAAATLALLESAPMDVCARALAQLDAESATQRAALVLGLQRARRGGLEAALIESLPHASGPGIAARLEVLAARRARPGAWLREYLLADVDQVELARAAASLVRHGRSTELLAALVPLANAPDVELRRRTIETALSCGVPGAWELASHWAFCRDASPLRRDALTWVALLGSAAAHEQLLAQLDDPTRRAATLWALGFTGRVAAVDACMDLLADAELGPLAGEVVCAIAGLPRDDDRFWRAAPDDDDPDAALPPLEHDDLDADLVPSSDAMLPVPEPQPILAWWQARRVQLEPSRRYLDGQPLSHTTMLAALEHAPLRRRHALALALALRSGGALDLDTRALCPVQREQLAALAGLGAIDWQGGLG